MHVAAPASPSSSESMGQRLSRGSRIKTLSSSSATNGNGVESNDVREPLVKQTRRVRGVRLFLQQLEVLLLKNYTLTKRNKPAAVLQVLAIFVFILLIYGTSKAITSAIQSSTDALQSVTSPPVVSVGNIPDCATSTLMLPGCYSFLWAPNTDPVAASIVANIMANNNPPIGAGSVLGFVNVTQANAWMQGLNGYSPHFQLVLGVYEFFTSTISQTVDFGVQINGTSKSLRGKIQNDLTKVLLPMQVAAEREIARYLAATVGGTAGVPFGSSITSQQAVAAIPIYSPHTSEFAHPPSSATSLVGQIAPTFLLAAAMFTFTIQIFNVVTERETKLRSAMRVMGVSDGVWWASQILWDVCVVNIISSLLIVAFGNAFPFDLFRKNQFSVVWMTFWLFECSLTGLGYFLSTFVSKASGSTFMGFTIFLFGFIFQLVVTFGGVPFTPQYGSSQWGSVSGSGQYRFLQVLFSLFAPTVFAKSISDLGTASATASLSGIKWRTRDSYCFCACDPRKASCVSTPDFTYLFDGKTVHRHTNVCGAKDYADFNVMFPGTTGCDYSINECWQWMVLDFFLFFTAALVADRLLSNEYGVRTYSFKSAYDWAASCAFVITVCVVIAVGADVSATAASVGVAIAFLIVKTLLYVLPRVTRGCFGACRADSGGLGKALPAAFVASPTLEATEAAGKAAGGELPAGLDGDVGAEEEAIKARLRERGMAAPLEPNVAVEVRGLVKSWKAFHAVRGNFFRVENGKLFALLGPNGAGKTTTINLLTGVLPVTAGDACVAGHSVAGGELPAIRRRMGVCPQFDVLWGEMTAREHLVLFAALKGLPRSEWAPVSEELLQRTKLSPAADRRSSGYSGGMKRRLSVAVALIGDPEVVYLDEPTTGMDPITRRYVWDIILEAKQGRAIVLTTHSMEEADVLADTITIIAKGRLRCFGSALRLKTKFGTGFRIAVSVDGSAGATGASSSALSGLGGSTSRMAGLGGSTQRLGGPIGHHHTAGMSAASDRTGTAHGNAAAVAVAQRVAGVIDFFKEQLGVDPTETGRAYTTFTVPRAQEAQLAAFLHLLAERKRELGVTDVQMSLATLEQVFLRIAKDAEVASAVAESRTISLSVDTAPNGGGSVAVVLGWGVDQGVLPGTDEPIDVVWVQDDEGRLQYSHHFFRGARYNDEHTHARRKCLPCC